MRQVATIIIRRIEASGLRRSRRQSFKGTRVRILHWSKPLEAIVYKSSCVHFDYLSYFFIEEEATAIPFDGQQIKGPSILKGH